MSKFKKSVPLTDEGQIDIGAWLTHLRQYRPEVSHQIESAVEYVQVAGAEQATASGVSCLLVGLEMANTLVDLQLDDDAMTAAILYATVQATGISLEDITEQFGSRVSKILSGVFRMEVAHLAHGRLSQSAQLSTTIDNLRKMLLAMVDDVRVVLIKLAERLTVLKHVAIFGAEERKRIASETMSIYAPLANRLGVGQLKWQLEDYAFRYLEPEKYQTLSKSLKERRLEREAFVNQMHSALEETVVKLNISHFKVSGRVKHIYSIYKKMQYKKVPIEEIYDVTAVRVLVDTVEDCYSVLGAVHSRWDRIQKEFDDYIANPKPNGYRSLHTAIYGPDHKVVEVQIRTFDMHKEAELGVAAHWLYKEGVSKQSGYEAKIAWLRQLMNWQEEMAESDVREREAYAHIFNDRVYAFTPNGDVLDMPAGATPIDFAYEVHSEVGNHCRGAKANGKMVPLTYALQMGDVIEILTSSDHTPSRDWLVPYKGYITTPRARAKVHHYFRQQDHQRHFEQGEELLNRELKKTGIQQKITDSILKKLHQSSKSDLFAAIGRGDVGVQSVIHLLQGTNEVEKAPVVLKEIKQKQKPKPGHAKPVFIKGIDNLLTHVAGCCHPIPGDEIVGYVTLGQGISIHQQDCGNVQLNGRINPDRIINISWGDAAGLDYTVDLVIIANNTKSLHADINTLFAAEKLTILQLIESVGKNDIANIHLTIRLENVSILPLLLQKISQLPDVIEAKRQGASNG